MGGQPGQHQACHRTQVASMTYDSPVFLDHFLLDPESEWPAFTRLRPTLIFFYWTQIVKQSVGCLMHTWAQQGPEVLQ